MKFFKFFLPVIIVGLFSCNSEPKTTGTLIKDSSSTAPVTDVKLPGYMCFAKRSVGDTFWLQLNVFENIVTGNLKYIFKEKDSNKGELEGKMKGDTLMADYTFMSEGQKSVRQVAFLIKDSVATEGYGDLEEKEGKMIFKNPQALTFGKGIVMMKTSCAE
ncbi:MAG: hypothetical protein H7Y86_16615 [Rhizobacter sp.]|nr:hypothetical protein [Ferruginibacter sp.]